MMANIVQVDKNVAMKSKLKERVVQYWENRSKKQFSKTYSYELPYQTYVHSKRWYENFFQNAPRFTKVVIKKIQCDQHVCTIGLLLFPEDMSGSYDTVFLYDKWIVIDGVWYHKFNDVSLPIFR